MAEAHVANKNNCKNNLWFSRFTAEANNIYTNATTVPDTVERDIILPITVIKQIENRYGVDTQADFLL